MIKDKIDTKIEEIKEKGEIISVKQAEAIERATIIEELEDIKLRLSALEKK